MAWRSRGQQQFSTAPEGGRLWCNRETRPPVTAAALLDIPTGATQERVRRAVTNIASRALLTSSH